jgi:membrane protease YdiL (CAAX protease family)
MDKKRIFVYLAFTFVVGYAAQFGLLFGGLIAYQRPTVFHTLLLAAVMWIPALGALTASLLCPDPGRPMPKIWPLPAGTALWLIAAVPLLFAVNYAMSSLFGFVGPQWGLSTLMGQLSPSSLEQIPPNVMPVLPGLLTVFGIALSIVLGATVVAAAALGCELGWRGYLLPRLAGKNRVAVHAVMGLLWGLWLLPLVLWWFRFRNDYEGLVPTVLCSLAMAVALGAALNEIVLRTGHIGLAALALGLFVSQERLGLSFWPYLFPSAELPWAGAFSVFAVALWLFAATFPFVLIGKAAWGPVVPPAAKKN